MAALVGILVLWAGRRTIWQTTLVDAWWWTTAAVGAWSGAELAAAVSAPRGAASWLEPLRFTAISISLCPMIAVMGAKRPQHGVWNFVVLSLLAIVALPAAEVLFLRPGARLMVGDARSWFLWALVLLPAINFVPTRFWLASLLVAAGQLVALSAHLALLHRQVVGRAELVGLVACCGGLVAAWIAAKRNRQANGPHDRLWLSFRDSFGLFWGLRLQERVNAAAQQSGWGIELTWLGFVWRTNGSNPAKIEPAIESAVRGTLKGLLRRFVSSEWIAECSQTPLD